MQQSMRPGVPQTRAYEYFLDGSRTLEQDTAKCVVRGEGANGGELLFSFRIWFTLQGLSGNKLKGSRIELPRPKGFGLSDKHF